ncbi:CsbD family protein [Enterococcus faecalis]|nr:CsbD family protein [Enterococcus faecalis]EPI38138.1 CsbD-like protein [Enterococcus faecalis LA3B-2]HCQ8740302.1 CsbD family protein [Enterococcus faecalis]HCQ9317453.1 CsbD family protein [Enterococcus faecalis]
MEVIPMKKSGIIVGFLATAFGLAVVNKMQKMNTNKDSVKGKAKEVAGKVIGNEQMQAEGTLDQVIGASKEVLEDLKQSISGIAGAGTSEKVSGKARESVGNVTGDDKQKAEGFLKQATGQAKETISNTKEKVEDVAGDIKDEFER